MIGYQGGGERFSLNGFIRFLAKLCSAVQEQGPRALVKRRAQNETRRWFFEKINKIVEH